jgi:hypothetical protein
MKNARPDTTPNRAKEPTMKRNLQTTAPDASPLTAIEQRELLSHEHVIKSGLETFIEVGEALLSIRDGKLYRATHRTFEDYCRERWGMTDRRARQLIVAAEIAVGVSETGTIVPKNEGQVRPLVGVPVEERSEVWKRAQEIAASEGKALVAKTVQSAIDERKPTKRRQTVEIETEVELLPGPPTPPPSRPAAIEQEIVAIGGIPISSEPERKFKNATKSKRLAERWWYRNATPRKRGEFLLYILRCQNVIEVDDKAKFIAVVTELLNATVKDQEGTR